MKAENGQEVGAHIRSTHIPLSKINTSGVTYSPEVLHQELRVSSANITIVEKNLKIREVEICCLNSQVKKHFTVADVTLRKKRFNN